MFLLHMSANLITKKSVAFNAKISILLREEGREGRRERRKEA